MAIQNGSRVSIHYSVKVEGNVIDTSQGREPLTYVQGEGQMIPGLEEKLAGLEVGARKSMQLTPAEAYGEYDPEAVRKIPRDSFADAGSLKVGSIVEGAAGGQNFQAVVIAVGPADVTLDMNHPLAGKSLDFEVEVVKVEAA